MAKVQTNRLGLLLGAGSVAAVAGVAWLLLGKGVSSESFWLTSLMTYMVVTSVTLLRCSSRMGRTNRLLEALLKQQGGKLD